MPVSQICHELHSHHFPGYPHSRHTIAAFLYDHPDIERDYRCREYCFYRRVPIVFLSRRIETLLMQNSAHCVAKTVAGGPAAIANTLYNLINTGLTHWL